jgi:tetratricopeptide (TPR) repeat protein
MSVEAKTLLNLAQQARKRGDHLTSLEHLRSALAINSGQISINLEMAWTLRELGRLDEAEAAFQEVLKQKPAHVAALAGLGQIVRKRGDRVASVAYFEAAAAADPDQLSLKLEMAWDLRELGRLDEAEAVFQEIVQKEPAHFHALVGLGQIARKRGDRTTSLTYFQAAAAAEPNRLPIKLEMAWDLRELGRLDEAEVFLQAILKQQPDHFMALVTLGHIARQQGNLSAAVGHLKAASNANPPDDDARLGLASAFRELSELQTAEYISRQVLSSNPGHSNALVELGLIARTKAKRADALWHFRSAVKASSADVRAYVELAAELKDHGLYNESERAIQEALKIDPDNVQARMQRGYIKRHMGTREGARIEFRRISEHFPDFAQAQVELAIEERALGNTRDAEQILERVVTTNPNHLWGLAELAESARLAGDFEKALCLSKRIIELHPGGIWPYVNTSQTLDDLGEHAAAFDLLDTAARLLGNQPAIVCKRAELLKRAGYLYEARRLVEAALHEHPQIFAIWSHCIQFDIHFGDFEAATRKLQDFTTKLVSELARIHMFRGQLAEAQWKFDEALEHYRLSQSLNPHDLWIRSEIIRACLLCVKTEEAREHLEVWTRLNKPAAAAQGRSFNLSQSSIAQIYEEFVLNRPLIDQLVEIRSLLPKDRIAPLQSLVRRNPDHTPSAIQLIIALRQAEFLQVSTSDSARNAAGPIPQTIVQYWDNPDPPADVQALMETWRAGNPGYAYQLFDDATAQRFLLQNYPPHVLQAYRRAGNAAEKADLFRLAYLYAKGGIYVDADDRCLASISNILPARVTLAVYQEDYALGVLAVGTLGNNFLAAAPNNAVIGRALALAIEALNRGDTDIVWLKTGPALITRAFAQIASETLLKLPAWLENIAVLERCRLSQVSAVHCFTAYKNTTQHWTNTKSR